MECGVASLQLLVKYPRLEQDIDPHMAYNSSNHNNRKLDIFGRKLGASHFPFYNYFDEYYDTVKQ